MGLTQTWETAIGLASLGAKASANQTLQFLIRTETEHFLPTAHGIFQFQVIVNQFEELVELKGIPVAKDIYQFVSNMIRNAT